MSRTRASIRRWCEPEQATSTRILRSGSPVRCSLPVTDASGNRLIKTDYNNFAPRLGIAYSPSAKWSFRTGFGVFFSQESKNSIFDMSRGIGRPRQSRRSISKAVPTADLSELHQYSASCRCRSPPGLPGEPTTICRRRTRCSTCSTSRGRLGTNSTLEVGYTGNQSRKVAYLVNANAPLPGITPFDAREPYPEWHGIQYLVSDGIGNYNALSGKLTQRFGAGLTTMFSYTWSKALDENSAIRGTGVGLHPR